MSNPDIIINDFVDQYKNGWEKYILLSSWQADLGRGMAYPLVSEEDNALCVFLFSSLDSVLSYVRKFKPKPIGPYSPIGILPSKPEVLSAHLISLQVCEVRHVMIMDDGPDAAYTTMHDILILLDAEPKSSISLRKMHLVHIYPYIGTTIFTGTL